jgi:hypothetical protein
MPEVSLKEVNELEKTFLELISYNLNVKGSEYAKYYFILKTLSGQENK